MQGRRGGQGQAGVLVRAISPDQRSVQGIQGIQIADQVAEVDQHALARPIAGTDNDARAHFGHGLKAPAHAARALVQRKHAAVLTAHKQRVAHNGRLRARAKRIGVSKGPLQLQIGQRRGGKCRDRLVEVAPVVQFYAPAADIRARARVRRARRLRTGRRRQRAARGRRRAAGEVGNQGATLGAAERLGVARHHAALQGAQHGARGHNGEQAFGRRSGCGAVVAAGAVGLVKGGAALCGCGVSGA